MSLEDKCASKTVETSIESWKLLLDNEIVWDIVKRTNERLGGYFIFLYIQNLANTLSLNYITECFLITLYILLIVKKMYFILVLLNF